MKTNAKAKILDILTRLGSRGATTMELIHDTGNPAAARRVWDLQQEGHRIEKVDEGGGVFRWIYRGAPLPQGPKLTQRSLLDLITRDMVAVGKDEKPRHIRGVRGFVSQF